MLAGLGESAKKPQHLYVKFWLHKTMCPCVDTTVTGAGSPWHMTQAGPHSARVWLVGPTWGPVPPRGSFIAQSWLVLWVKMQVESDRDLGQMAVLT